MEEAQFQELLSEIRDLGKTLRETIRLVRDEGASASQALQLVTGLQQAIANAKLEFVNEPGKLGMLRPLDELVEDVRKQLVQETN